MTRPPSEPAQSVDEALRELAQEDVASLERLFMALYQEIYDKARGLLGGQVGHTLQPTALVNEAFLRIQQAGGPWQDRGHFLYSAARAMRHILVDHFRRKNSAKAGARETNLEVELIADDFQERASDLLGLHEALKVLEERDPVMAKAVELRFFGGASMQEVAELVDMPHRTLERRWGATRNWLYSRLV